ncbi:MAG TPA: helix-turn-helix domain-containing protein [Ktedonobacterales bacterium]
MRIIEATRACLTETPLLAVSLERIATTAGVARRTLYTIFGSRLGLFEAIEQDLYQRGGFAEIQDAFNTHDDARQILDLMLPASIRLHLREEAVLRALFLQALIDPDAAALTRRMTDGRVGGMRHLASLLLQQGYVQPRLTHAEVADVLAMLTDTIVLNQLFTVLGLSPDAVLRRLRILANSILRADVPLSLEGGAYDGD